jgi:uncharacterized protein YukE
MSSLDSKISALENLAQQARSAASQFSEAAETLRNLTGSLNSSAEALTAGPQMWGGNGSRAFDASWFKYQTYSTQTASNLEDTASALNSMASQVESAAQKAKDAEIAAIAVGAAMIAAGAAAAIFTFGASEVAADAAAAAEEAAAEVAAEAVLEAAIDEADSAASSVIEEVVDSMVDVTDVGEEGSFTSADDTLSTIEEEDAWAEEDGELPAEEEPLPEEEGDPWEAADELGNEEDPSAAESSRGPSINPTRGNPYYPKGSMYSYNPLKTAYTQEDPYTCMPAVTRMVMDDLGEEVPEEADVITESGAAGGRSGMNFQNLENFFQQRGISMDVDDNMSEAQLEDALQSGKSFVTGITNGRIRHAVIVDGMENGLVNVRDPAMGPYSVSLSDFLNSWFNIGLFY